MSYVVGIDLGTTYSCVAYVDEYGKPVVLKNSDGDHTTPSVVMIENADNVVVGMEAKRSIEVEPDKTVQFIKRKMGTENDKVVLNGITYSAPEISAYILKKIVADANEELKQTGVIKEGEEIKDVVITCPAYFGMNERQATKTAGELAGLNVLNIINEPTAAAISYGISGDNKDETVLVYDLGGGTFDITVMNIHGSEISVVCTDGDHLLGGKDWDDALIEYVRQRYEEEYGEDLSEDPETFAALYVEAENWKKSLTVREKINITVNGEAGRLREELTRSKFEELTEDILKRTQNMLDRVLGIATSQGYSLDKIDKVLLVGGSSRMPQVAQMIERNYQVIPSLQDPDEAVAKGAAVYAMNQKNYHDFVQAEAEKTGKTVEELTEDNLVSGSLDKKYALTGGVSGDLRINITNVLSRTYGISALNEYDKVIICNMLLMNSKLPASVTQNFYTSDNNQKQVDLKLYESRSIEKEMEIEERTPITVIPMVLNKAVPKGTEIEITMVLDESGLLHVIGKEMFSGTKLDETIELSNQMSELEIRQAGNRLSQAVVE